MYYHYRKVTFWRSESCILFGRCPLFGVYFNRGSTVLSLPAQNRLGELQEFFDSTRGMYEPTMFYCPVKLTCFDNREASAP